MLTQHAPRLALCTMILAASLGTVCAENLYVANSSNGRISMFDTATGVASPYGGDTSSLVTPLALALDGSGRLVVADNQRNRILRYDASGAGPFVLVSQVTRPDGVSFSQSGDLFFVTSPDGATSSKQKDVYILPGGAAPAVKIASLGDSTLLRDTAVVPAGPYAGQLLVLSSKPAFIARFSMTTLTSWTREMDFATGMPGEPTGLRFTTSGDLLVSGIEGVISRYDSTGNRLSDFASGLGNGATRIAVGNDGTVYVTNRNNPSVFRFDSAGTRLTEFGGTLQSPAGLAMPERSPTPVGTNVVVTPIPGVTLTYDQVTKAGFTSALRTLLGPDARTTPCGNTIPSFVGLPVGDTAFTVIRIETTAFYTDTIQEDLAHPDGNSRGFHAACPPNAAGFEDATILAVPGDPRTRTPLFSEFVIGTDLRPNTDVIQIKRDALNGTLAPGTPAAQSLGDATLQTLRNMIRNASDLITLGDFAGAIDQLQGLKSYVKANSGTSIPNSESARGGNVAGTLFSQAATLIFSLSLQL